MTSTESSSQARLSQQLSALLSQAPLDELSRSYLMQLLLEADTERSVDSILDLVLPYMEDDEKLARSISSQICALFGCDKPAASKPKPHVPIAPNPAASSKTTSVLPKASGPSSHAEAPPAPPRATHSSTSAEEIESYDDVITGICDTRGRFPPGLSRDVKVGITLTVGENTLLERADLILTYGIRYGLVGINGAGKSTLLDRIARGRIIGFPKHLRCMHLRQEITGDERSVLQSVLEADAELQRLQRREQELLGGGRAGLKSSTGSQAGTLSASSEGLECTPEALSELQEISSRLQEIEADTAVGRATKLLLSMGFSNQALDTPTIKLSGGWRMRVSLACSLFLKPDVLLLDEPTNHLDLPSVVWLQHYLVEHFDGTLVCVSHDRSFLDALCQHTIHMHKKQLVNYPCCFSEFLIAREEKIKSRAALQAGIDGKREQLKQSIKNIEAQARGNKQDQKRLQQAASRKKKINRVGAEKTIDGKKFNAQSHGIRLGAINANEGGWDSKGRRTAGSVLEATDPEIRFSIPSAPPLSSHAALLTVSNGSYAYPDRPTVPAVRDINLRLDAGSRVVLLGANGSGKTTLMRLLAGELEPAKGTDLRRAQNLRVAYFTQHFADALPLDSTPLQHLAAQDPSLRHLVPRDGSPLSLSALSSPQHQTLRAHLSAFGLQGDIVLRKISTLSGGQKSRLTLAALTLEAPHLLLLDEPSNHLDFLSIRALASALRRYRGALVLVSHDQLLGSDASSGSGSDQEDDSDDEDNPRPEPEIMVVSKGRARRFEGDFTAYKAALLAERL